MAKLFAPTFSYSNSRSPFFPRNSRVSSRRTLSLCEDDFVLKCARAHDFEEALKIPRIPRSRSLGDQLRTCSAEVGIIHHCKTGVLESCLCGGACERLAWPILPDRKSPCCCRILRASSR
jgi:hypothetical protein